jgi:hypothetical protein
MRLAFTLAFITSASLIVEAFGDVTVVRVIIENDKTWPGDAQIWFPHLSEWKATDRYGAILLPQPYDGDEIIEVSPNDRERFGRQFRRVFPAEDGYVSIVALNVTANLEERGKDLAREGRFREAAAAYGLAAARLRKSNPPLASQRADIAYGFLGKVYGIPNPCVRVDGSCQASPDLLGAINKDPKVTVKPTKAAFDPADFKNIAGLPTLSPLIGDTQRKARAR